MSDSSVSKDKIKIEYVPIERLKELPGNPRIWSDKAKQDLATSLERFDMVNPLLVNFDYTVLGGNFRLHTAKKLGYTEVPCVFLNIRDKNRAKELALRLNKNQGAFDFELLAEFDPALLDFVGFTSEELDEIFDASVDEPEIFDLQKELLKLDIKEVKVQKSDVYKLGPHRLMCGDSTVEADILKLMKGEQADMCLTDEPYLLDYVNAKRHGKPTTGFGAKKNRRYLETESLPENFVELWMANVAKVAKPDFGIIAFENWKNTRILWAEIEKYWKVRNMIIWRLPNRHQGYASKHKLFNKYDIAMLGTSPGLNLNTEQEEELLQNEYEIALFAISGDPQWEGYQRGRKYQPTDFVEFQASDEKSSQQNIVFGTKPLEVLLPFMKVLTKRGDLVIEPFTGSGSTLIAAEKLKRRCYGMEKSPVYCEVIMRRWERLTGGRREKVNE